MAENLELKLRMTLDGKEVVAGLDLSREQFRKLAVDAKRAADAVGGGFSKASEGVRSISTMLERVRNLMLGAFAVHNLRQAVDGFTQLQSRLALVEDSLQGARAAFAGVFAIAQKSGQDVASVAEVYQRIGRNARQLGLDQQGVLETTQAVANAVRLSGASAASAQAALIQFGQALASGALRGDELNSVMEQTPALAEAIARGMGKTVGELRQLGEAGKLTAQDVIGAIRNESARLEAEAGRMGETIGMSLTRLGNAWQRMIGENTGGAARAIAASISALAENLEKVTQAALTAGAAIGAMFIATKWSAWTSAAGGFLAALARINPITLGIGAAFTALGIAMQDWRRSGESAVESVRNALERLRSSAARVSADIAAMSGENVRKSMADIERQRDAEMRRLESLRAKLAAVDARTRVTDEKGRVTGFDSDAIRRRDALQAEILGAEQALSGLNKELDAIRKNMRMAGTRDIEAYFRQFGSNAEEARQKLKDLEEATNKALAAARARIAAGDADKSEIARIKSNYEAKKREILKGDGAAAQRLPRLVEESEADLIRAQSILDREKALLEAAWNAKKLAAQDYYAQLNALAERQLALDTERMQRELDALRAHLEALKRMRGKNAGADEQIAATEKRIDELMARIEARQRQIATEIEIRQADSLRIRFEMAEQAIAQIMARVRAEEQSINIARENYLISEAQAREKILALHKAASEEMRGHVSMMADLANNLGEQYKIRAMEAANEWSRMSSDAAAMNSALREQIELLHAIRAVNEATVDARHQAGITTDMEYLREKEASNRRTIQLLREEQSLLRAMGQEAAALQIEAQIIRLSAQLDLVADKFRKIFEDHFATFFENVLSGTKKFKEVFLDLLRGILDDMKKLFARELSQQLMKVLSGKFGDSPSLEGRGFFSFLADLFFPSTGKGFKLLASGGYVTGPGTSTSDSIPARLSAGEYVIRAEAVRRVGVAFLDAINGLKLPPQWSAGRLAFAAGGLAPAVAQPAPQQPIRIVNAVDPELARDYLESPAGERVLVNVITRNAAAIRNILGG